MTGAILDVSRVVADSVVGNPDQAAMAEVS
jgi:hypothetical protein